MKLYKYINFKTVNNAGSEVWQEPANENRLFFSPLPIIRSINDEDEFKHDWEINSWLFNTYITKNVKPRYDRLFDSARTLCLSRHFSRECWARFCADGGVCYEFQFSDSLKNPAITSDKVIYANSKVTNVPQFIIQNVASPRIRKLISQSEALLQAELAEIMQWFNSKEPHRLSVEHIVYELVFKKLKDFQVENEYRFIHPEKPMDGKRIPLIESKLDFQTLGLTLKRIFTSDIEKVKNQITHSIKISKPSFL